MTCVMGGMRPRLFSPPGGIDVQTDLSGVWLHEFRRERVADHQGGGKFAALKGNLVVSRKALEQSRFTDCNGSVLGRVKEPALGRVYATAGDGGGDFVPRHPAVNVFKAVTVQVTLQLSLAAQRVTTATVLWNGGDYASYLRTAHL